MLCAAGFCVVDNPKEADAIIVNTCAFIQSAKEESIAAIIDLARFKTDGICKFLIVCGCMAQKYAGEMRQSMPEIDRVVVISEYDDLINIVNALSEGGERSIDSQKSYMRFDDSYLLRHLPIFSYFAYMKIADGCDNRCSFCLIPELRGRLRSRSMDDLLHEADILIKRGIKELILVAQDTAAYGMDIAQKSLLPDLLEKLSSLDFRWIRVLYCHPEHISKELLEIMSQKENICHYLDLPIQHFDSNIMRLMNRADSNESLLNKIMLIRQYMPDIVLRTTVMVGFPGEDNDAWRNLNNGLNQVQFDWVGVFAYSREKDTPAYNMLGQLPKSVKSRRYIATSKLVQEITDQKLSVFIGRVLEVLVEELIESETGLVYSGRSYVQSPEIDGLIYFSTPYILCTGDFVKVRITDINHYNMEGILEEVTI